VALQIDQVVSVRHTLKKGTGQFLFELAIVERS